MEGKYFGRIALAIILFAALIGLGQSIYSMGVMQGLAIDGRSVAPVPAPPSAAPVTPYGYGPYYHPWGFGFGSGIFGLIFPILFFFLIFALLRGLFFRGRGGWHGGPFRGNWSQDVPPGWEEWHRRMHEKEAGQQGEGEEEK